MKNLTIYSSLCSLFLTATIGLFCLLASGCTSSQVSEAEAIGASLVPLVQQGVVTAADAYATYQSVNQNLTAANVITGKLSVSKVITGAQAILGSPATAQATQSLTTAANTFVVDVNNAIAAAKAAGVTSPTAITNAVSESGASTVTTIAALPAPTTFEQTIPGPGDMKREIAFEDASHPRTLLFGNLNNDY